MQTRCRLSAEKTLYENDWLQSFASLLVKSILNQWHSILIHGVPVSELLLQGSIFRSKLSFFQSIVGHKRIKAASPFVCTTAKDCRIERVIERQWDQETQCKEASGALEQLAKRSRSSRPHRKDDRNEGKIPRCAAEPGCVTCRRFMLWVIHFIMMRSINSL